METLGGPRSPPDFEIRPLTVTGSVRVQNHAAVAAFLSTVPRPTYSSLSDTVAANAAADVPPSSVSFMHGVRRVLSSLLLLLLLRPSLFVAITTAVS